MTAEIAILNKHAIALAADSAVTLGTGKKIYNSADKLFALSKFCPVGIMVYGSASFLETPWEVLVKQYRQKVLGERSFKVLRDFADDFLKFLRTTPLIPVGAEDRFISHHCTVVLNVIRRAIENDINKRIETQGSVTSADTKDAVDKAIQGELATLSKANFLDGTNTRRASALQRQLTPGFTRLVKDVLQNIPLNTTQLKELGRICALGMYKARFTTGRAGIVIAGYGEGDIFPSIETYELEGRLLGYLKCRRIDNKSNAIQLNNRATITAFAQSEMVATFMDGLHPDYEDILKVSLKTVFDELPSILAKRFSKFVPNKNEVKLLTSDLDGLLKEIWKNLDIYSRKEFIEPVLNTVAALPKDELAKMAEALVSLTSFRRKVTPGAETVGGPIDVLVISKGDGLVWIKRKHYFDRELNHHYFANYFRGA